MHASVREIRRRLLFVLLRAFVVVVFLSFLFFTLTVGYFLTSASTPVPFPFVSALEGYYLARGSWDGAAAVFDSVPGLHSLKFVLLDAEQRILVDRRPAGPEAPGSPYELQQQDLMLPLTAQSKIVGYLVLPPFSMPERFGLARAVMLPVAIIALILGMFLVVAATLLIRRFVNPLADVIYAAREVSDGKLSARIPTKGPQDLRSLSESFNEMAASLERSDRERRDLLADIAHELRTPLSVIRGRLEGVVDGIYPENGPQVSMALEQTYLLQRLVDDLRLLTLAEARQLAFDTRQVDLSGPIQRVLEMLSAEAQERNISLVFRERRGDLSALVDPQRIEQVISNLVGNAIRYIPEGGNIWLTARGAADVVQITVNDDGPGVPPKDLPYLFDRFWRKEKSRSRATGGTGLGLAIARQLVEAQGGTIIASNRAAGGLQVEIRLKREASE